MSDPTQNIAGITHEEFLQFFASLPESERVTLRRKIELSRYATTLPFHPDDTKDDDLAWVDEQNPFIGHFPGQTMINCAQVLSIVDLATQQQEGHSDDWVMGYYLILLAVRKALWYHSTTKAEVAS